MVKQRPYALFEKSSSNRWVRVHPKLAFRKSIAVQVYQSRLLAHSLYGEPERCLKPVKE